MEPFITFIRKNGYGERTFHLKNHGYFKLPAHFRIGLDKRLLEDKLLETSKTFRDPDDFIEVFERMLYQHWQVEELRTCRSFIPFPSVAANPRDSSPHASLTLIIIRNGANVRTYIKHTRKPKEPIADFAKRIYTRTLKMQGIWRERFIRTPVDFLTFSETLEPEKESEDLFTEFRKEEPESNHQFKLVGKTKYQRNIAQIGRHSYFIIPKYMTLAAYANGRVSVYLANSDGTSSHMSFDGVDPAAAHFHLKNALKTILKQRGVLEYHTSKELEVGVFPEGPGFHYRQPAAIRYRDGTGLRIFSRNQRELLIQQAADKRWIANNLETKSLEGLTILHKEFPKDPM